jgi:N-acetylglucosaminyldiphosphoundecaprenol N-acetyl-beta-D-mannosaminyltransferase
MLRLVKFLDFSFLYLSKSAILNRLSNGDFKNCSLHFIAASSFYNKFCDLRLRDFWNRGILVADSRPLSLYLRTKKSDLSQIRGTDFMRDFLSYYSSNSFLIGGDPNSIRVIRDVFEGINPKLKIVGTIHPAISSLNLKEELIFWSQEIQQSEATCVWIGLGSPKQDYVAQELSLLIEPPIIAVGAAFDYLSNLKTEAPILFRIFFLEWLFRLISEPNRLWKRYLLGNFYFITLIVRDISRNLSEYFVKSCD